MMSWTKDKIIAARRWITDMRPIYVELLLAAVDALEREQARKADDRRPPRKCGPKSPDHPSVGALCPACNVPFVGGDYTTLISLGPGASVESRQRAHEGRPYNAVAVEVHWGCAGGRDA